MSRALSPVSNSLVDTWGRKNRTLPDRQCKNCGQDFRPARATSKYCSRPCSWANNGGRNRKSETWWVNSNGYIEGRVWVDGKQRRVKQHRYFMEKHIGRRLKPSEDVHHKNGNTTDNRISNLQILDHAEHTRVTNAGREYRSGYRLNLTDAERKARSSRMKSMLARRNAA